MDDLHKTRIDTIIEMSDAIIQQTIQKIQIHGINDPQSTHLLAAAYAMSINRIDSVSPGFKKFMHKKTQSC